MPSELNTDLDPGSQPQRFARLRGKPTTDRAARLELHIAGKETEYRLYLQPSNFGEAFRLEEVEAAEDDWPSKPAETSIVTFENEWNHTCWCASFLECGRCKHVDSIIALREAGRL